MRLHLADVVGEDMPADYTVPRRLTIEANGPPHIDCAWPTVTNIAHHPTKFAHELHRRALERAGPVPPRHAEGSIGEQIAQIQKWKAEDNENGACPRWS